MLDPLRVRAIHGESAIDDAGRGRSSSLSCNSSAVARPPPADSPESAIREFGV